MTTYCVVEEKCADCVGTGWDARHAGPCGRCLTTGWVEVYTYATDEEMEIPDPPGADRPRSRTNAGTQNQAVENTLPVPHPRQNPQRSH